MIRIEALADAIGQLNDAQNPESESYKLRNPGMLKAFAMERVQLANEQGIRIFATYIGGYQALLKDLEIKCSGKSRAYAVNGHSKLKPQSTVQDLMASFDYRDDQAIDIIVRYLRTALNDKSVTAKTPLSFFLCQIQ